MENGWNLIMFCFVEECLRMYYRTLMYRIFYGVLYMLEVDAYSWSQLQI